MKIREGDLIETFDGNIFDVKGLIHPPEKVIAFIRYTPNPRGDRRRDKNTYQKVYALPERYSLLRKSFPQYLVYDRVFNEWLCEVPTKSVKIHYNPEDYLRKLCRRSKLAELEAAALRFSRLLKHKSYIQWNKIGISGSLLVGLQTPKSDIDIVVYGTKNCYRIYDLLKVMVNDAGGQVKSYNTEELKHLFDFRSKDTKVCFEDFVRTELRKVLQGTFDGYDYFIRCVKDWNEIDEQYGTVFYRSMGYAKIKAVVVDNSQMIFTPCRYEIDNVKIIEGQIVEPIQEIVSFRGRFCEQAEDGEFVLAQGKLERVQRRGAKEYYRLLLGNKTSDYMILRREDQ